jgi:hypothetical protein
MWGREDVKQTEKVHLFLAFFPVVASIQIFPHQSGSKCMKCFETHSSPERYFLAVDKRYRFPAHSPENGIITPFSPANIL